ncbi:glycosyltransferase [Ferruginibacter lapsinanis]|uniref:glycosyltransferase n=1 Tax=Ferruginibacter lapsinanis TaxID=563172 RepID=UPI001E5709A3|nr:glycosyltransferase [Ferruginibacter lapsinanis]UEG50682.1 glycosyltransferase [Ferruginibacter lapsinanis]
MGNFIAKTDNHLLSERPTVKGKFIYKNGEKIYLKGVTYGTFKPQDDGSQFPERDIVEKDITLMAANGFNCIRTYTVPPTYLLDIAASLNLHVMVGLPWEQHITFLDNSKDIIKRVKEAVQSCKNHPAILCYTIGNEIPSGIVRWYGKRKIENFLKRLYAAVKEVDPHGLVTYVNYPTTEYLDLSFLDFDCFNVYLETPEKLGAYISRLHNLSGDRPLVLAEIGLDSKRNGIELQGEVLSWQVKTVFEKGCAGIFIFSWTDEWWRGGFEIDDWDFGIVDRERNPKPAMHSVKNAMNNIPYASKDPMPMISVIICTYNGGATIKDTLEGVLSLDYPNYEVIVVNDGSTDDVPTIAAQFPVKLITTPNKGLSNARNTGMYAAKGEILAYIDDDASPDPQWLTYLAYAYATSDHGCIGGPNISPEGSGFLATCVANAPGGPVHVLLNDEIAEHVPGCNMTFRRDALMQIHGFDPVYRTAGDDVDVCWRIQESGRTVGFHPAALVWHKRRNSLKAFWRQQKGYGKAEALLEAKWPEKYNAFGHLAWAGRIYGNGLTIPIKTKKDKVFHGTWGTALFQSVYQPANGLLSCLPLMPEWYLGMGLFAVLGSLGFIWPQLLWCWLAFAAAMLIVIIQAAISASKKSSLTPAQRKDPRYRLMIIFLHIIQPVARLYGRIKHGLTPWRKRGAAFKSGFLFTFFPKTFLHWSDQQWKSTEEWLTAIEGNLAAMKTCSKRGGEFDRWDIQVRNGLFSKSRGLLTIEEHGAQKQYLKFKCWPCYSSTVWMIMLILLALGGIAVATEQWVASIVFASLEILFIARFLVETARSLNSLHVGFTMLSTSVLRSAEFKIIQHKKVLPKEVELIFEPSTESALIAQN